MTVYPVSTALRSRAGGKDVTLSPGKDAWDAGNGTWFKAELTDDGNAWCVYRYEGDPDDPDTPKHRGYRHYPARAEAEVAARDEATHWHNSHR
jgi:hypothetical protein